MIKPKNLSCLNAISLLLGFIQCTSWDYNLVRVSNQYVYQSYYSLDKDSCIVANEDTGNKPTIQFCNGDYTISNQTLILPRNIIPICAYFPQWYDLSSEFYHDYIKDNILSGNSTFEESMKECATELSSVSKSRSKEMYKVNAHELMCMRVSHYNLVHYGKDSGVVELRKKIETLIHDKVKWKNTEFQADLIMSTYCFGTNKQSCIALVEHLLDERNNSALNLLGYNIKTIPTTWLYADGIDIVMLHISTEIMGMTLELK
ncbi:hypothetical protein CONCODRAFT_6648, partial [Conidiobolus coronatus NRRL 28638]